MRAQPVTSRFGWVAGALVVVAATVAGATFASESLMGAEEKSFTRDVTLHVDLKYLQWLPEGYEMSDAKWPLPVFLHGAGETGDDLKRHSAWAATGRGWPRRSSPSSTR